VGKIGRPGMSDAQKREVWQRWKQGQSLSEIGRALGKVPGSIHGVVKANGGFTPADRTRRPGSLTLPEREEISRGLAAGVSLRTIAAGLGRPASTISREVGRHGGVRRYRAADAEARAWDNALRPRCVCWRGVPSLQAVVAAKLAPGLVPAADLRLACSRNSASTTA
jgi:IS30 family transposase